MHPKSMQTWVSNEMERLSTRLERYKPSGSGYNRIKPMLLSRSVTHMLNNPLPVEDQIGRNSVLTAPTRESAHNHQKQQQQQQQQQQQHQQQPPLESRTRGVLSCSQSEWEEVYPTVVCSRTNNNNSHEKGATATIDPNKTFVFYRNCSTRIT